MKKQKRTSQEKGITLVALIITIIVLLILAVVAIRAVQGDGIISKAKDAAKQTNIAQEKEELQMAVLEWQLVNKNGNPTLFSFLSEKYGEDSVQLNADKSVTVTMSSENRYKVTTSGEVTLLDETVDTGGAGSGETGGETGGEDLPNGKITVAQAQESGVLSTTENTDVYDEYGNKIVVPAGFKITTDASHVTEGIVIEDVSAKDNTSKGNQFVWIPVGDVYTTEDTEKTESNTTTITLGRYSWSGSTPNLVQPIAGDSTKSYTSEVAIGSHTELQPTANGKGPNGNAIAKNINNFYEKAIASHGYFIGRFEAGVSGYDETATNNNTKPSGATNWTKYTTTDGKDPQLVCKSNQQVWNYVTQNKASELCQSMYINKPYESDLINSYAWDTAIVFIQTFGANGVDGKETDSSTYASKNKSIGFRNTGLNPDKYRNIYDMSGNVYGWSTETSSYTYGPFAKRGGWYSTSNGYASGYTSSRAVSSATDSSSYCSFRPLLYV